MQPRTHPPPPATHAQLEPENTPCSVWAVWRQGTGDGNGESQGRTEHTTDPKLLVNMGDERTVRRGRQCDAQSDRGKQWIPKLRQQGGWSISSLVCLRIPSLSVDCH